MSLENSYRDSMLEQQLRERVVLAGQQRADALFREVVRAIPNDPELGPFIRKHGLRVMTHCPDAGRWERSYFWIQRKEKRTLFRHVEQTNVTPFIEFPAGDTVRLNTVWLDWYCSHFGETESIRLSHDNSDCERILQVLRDGLGRAVAAVEMRD